MSKPPEWPEDMEDLLADEPPPPVEVVARGTVDALRAALAAAEKEIADLNSDIAAELENHKGYIAELNAAEEREKRLREALKEVEWVWITDSDGEERQECPYCGGANLPTCGHMATCGLAALLKEGE